MATATTEQAVGVLVAQEVEGAGEHDGRGRRGCRPTAATRSAERPLGRSRLARSSASCGLLGGGEGAAAAVRPLPVHSTARASRLTGQLASMSSSTPSSESGPPCMYSIMPVQKLPLPTSAGIRSEASKRPVPSFSAVGQDLRRVGQDVVGVAVRPDVHVGRDAGRRLHAAHLALHVLGDEPVEEVDDLGPVAVRADDGELTGVEGALLVDRRAAGTSRSRRRPPRPRGRTGVDEARLAVEPAPGRVVEHRQPVRRRRRCRPWRRRRRARSRRRT